jgi:Integrase zinc binding domain
MTWPGLTQDVEHLCSTCAVCQLSKKERKKQGLLPPKTLESDPWVMVCVDLVVLFTIKTPRKTHSLLALTMIDPATGWLEIVEANNKSAFNQTTNRKNSLFCFVPTRSDFVKKHPH